jgi:hypothetical protein
MALSTNIMVHTSTLPAANICYRNAVADTQQRNQPGTLSKHASDVMSAWNAWHLASVNSGLLLTSSTAEAAKSQQWMKRSELAARSGNTVLPVPQPTSRSVAGQPCVTRD